MRPSRALAVTVLAFAAFIDLMDTTIVNVALPSIHRALGASPAQLEWVVGGYALAFAVLLVTAGRLGDMLGRQRVFIAGVSGFTVMSLLAASAATGSMLTGARIGQGACAALMVPQLLSSVQTLYKPAERAPVYGIIGMITGLAAVIGPLLGGWLVTSDAFGIGWRSIFMINVPVGVVIIALAIWLVPDTRNNATERLDLLGVALISSGVGTAMFALVQGRQLAWPAWVWLVLAASPVLLAAFVLQERHRQAAGRAPLLPMRLFADRGFTAGMVTQFSFEAAMVGFFLVLALYLQLGLHFSAFSSGLTLLPFSLGGFAGSGVSSPLSAKAGKPLVVIGSGMMAGATVWISQIVGSAGSQLSRWDLAPAMALSGIGLGLIVVPVVDVAVKTVAPRDAGAASGAFSTVQQVGAALGVSVVGLVFFDAARGFSGVALRHALTIADIAVLAGFILAGCAALLLPGRARGAVESPAADSAQAAAETGARTAAHRSLCVAARQDPTAASGSGRILRRPRGSPPHGDDTPVRVGDRERPAERAVKRRGHDGYAVTGQAAVQSEPRHRWRGACLA